MSADCNVTTPPRFFDTVQHVVDEYGRKRRIRLVRGGGWINTTSTGNYKKSTRGRVIIGYFMIIGYLGGCKIQ